MYKDMGDSMVNIVMSNRTKIFNRNKHRQSEDIPGAMGAQSASKVLVVDRTRTNIGWVYGEEFHCRVVSFGCGWV